MIAVLGDLIADLTLHVPSFPLQAGDLARASYFSIGPGGACNIAIQAARFGLEVAVLGEVGGDTVGSVVLEGLRRSGVDVSDVLSGETQTPVAGVVVDRGGEAAYAGYAGKLTIHRLADRWAARIRSAEALFADGWADHEAVPGLILDGLRLARENGVPAFFDPGPGNPEFDNSWHMEAAKTARVVIATEEEANRVTGADSGGAAARVLAEWGTELVVIKRGPGGCLLARDGEALHLSPSFPIQVVDTTGAGDGVDAAIIYGYLKGLDLEPMGTLANAVGAAKVKKEGTGLNMPTLGEIRAVLQDFGRDTGLVPSL